MKALILKIKELYQDPSIASATVFVSSEAISYYFTNSYFGNPIYHLSGFVTALLGIALDHASTFPIIRQMNKPEFERKGLKSIYYEANPIIGEHPSIRLYAKRATKLEIIALAGSTLFPPMGHGILLAIPIIFNNNRNIANEIQAELQTTAEVKI